MTIPFKQIPSNIRVPLFYAELDASHANTAGPNQRALIIGQFTAGTGTAVANIPVLSQGVAEAKTLGGPGSMLAQMVFNYRQNDTFGELWLLPLADDGSGVAATGTITVTAVPTVAGVLYLYIGGQLVTVSLPTGGTVTSIAALINTAINANTDLSVTSSPSVGVITLTAKNKGVSGNDIDIRFNYLGSAGGQSLPTSFAATIVAMASGAVNPSLTTGLANLLDMPFDFIVLPFTDSTSLNALQTFLNDTTGRWSWQQQVYGHVFTALRGTSGALTTAGLARNDQHATIMGFNDSPTPNWKWAAAIAAVTAISVRADPGVPMQTVALADILAPPLQSRFTLSIRNTLLFDGSSTFTVSQSGVVALENVVTTYQLNSFSQPDNSYLEIETMYLLMLVLRTLASVVTTKYARVKLAADGTRFAPGSNIVTPGIIRADIIAAYKTLEYNGFVQQSALFAQGLIVQINASNPSRVDVLWPGTLIEQLRIFAVLGQFRLQ